MEMLEYKGKTFIKNTATEITPRHPGDLHKMALLITALIK